MREQRCETCVYWLRFGRPPYASKGHCRVRAPILIEADGPPETVLAGRWPQTSSSDWCGEWRRDPDSDARAEQVRADEGKAHEEWRARVRADIDGQHRAEERADRWRSKATRSELDEA